MSAETTEKVTSKDQVSSSTELETFTPEGGNLSGSDLARLRGSTNVLTRVYKMPMFQVAMLGFIFFMCPGMFNALSGLGGGGQVDPTTSNNGESTNFLCGTDAI